MPLIALHLVEPYVYCIVPSSLLLTAHMVRGIAYKNKEIHTVMYILWLAVALLFVDTLVCRRVSACCCVRTSHH